jgi:AcrR family transcriptional regulator
MLRSEMNDSAVTVKVTETVTARPGKRARLIASAADLVYRQGVSGMTLADVAKAADVPAGNVYYYFHTREDLVAAVVATRIDQQQAFQDAFEALGSPRERLKGFIAGWADQGEPMTVHGCPMGGLYTDLVKIGGPLQHEAMKLFRMRVAWMEAQFQELGLPDADSRKAAITLLAGIDGAISVAHALGDADVIRDEAVRLTAWVDSVV